jgi:hypothetical protein
VWPRLPLIESAAYIRKGRLNKELPPRLNAHFLAPGLSISASRPSSLAMSYHFSASMGRRHQPARSPCHDWNLPPDPVNSTLFPDLSFLVTGYRKCPGLSSVNGMALWRFYPVGRRRMTNGRLSARLSWKLMALLQQPLLLHGPLHRRPSQYPFTKRQQMVIGREIKTYRRSPVAHHK